MPKKKKAKKKSKKLTHAEHIAQVDQVIRRIDADLIKVNKTLKAVNQELGIPVQLIDRKEKMKRRPKPRKKTA